MPTTLPDSATALHEIARTLLAADPSTAPAEALARIGPWFDADRAWLIRLDEALTQFWVSFEWCADGVQAFLPDLPGVPLSLIALPLRSFLRGQNVVYADIEKLPPDAQDLKEEMRREQNLATAGAPLFRNEKLVALVGVDDVRKTHAWTDEEMALLRRLGDLVLSAADRLVGESPGGPGATVPETLGCYLRAGNCHVQARWEEIVSISAEGDYSRVRLTSGRVFLELKALSVWEAMLPRDAFCRVHRSWILGWRHVERLHRGSGGRWTLDVEHEAAPIPVGRNHQKRVRDQINRRGLR